ncbi:hypothetical protein [Pseudomonas sp. GXZC]|uniref:hypothetical protein n=1 Tax=Pseudomonas sp. GXZC TaxID=3003351 RepID=UPI0022AB12BA|nr:hypothetical protein [Pseudomonas sp. GXZC]WAT32155.1 hypothetical protein OZ428_34405 [Pseudomonas sp. GXZC]
MESKSGSAYRRLAMTLIALQLAGCAAPGQLPSGFGGVFSKTEHAYKGQMSAQDQASSRAARSIFTSTSTGVIGYAQPEYQRRLARFHSARDVIKATGNQYSQEQFVEFSSALTDLLSYVDQIEAGVSTRKTAVSQQRIQASYQIQPGQTVTLNFNGYCMKAGPDRPYLGEGMQLIGVNDVWSPAYAGVYRKVMQQGRLGEPTPTRVYRGDQADKQVALWALQGLNDGELNPKVASSMTAKQRQVLYSAGLSPVELEAKIQSANYLNTSQPALTGLLSGQGLNGLISGAVKSAGLGSGFGNGEVAKAARSLQQFVDIPKLLTSPQVLSDPAALAAGLSNWAGAPSERTLVENADALSQYSLLAPGVAAQTISSGQLSGQFKVTNHSSSAFNLRPAEYIANARSDTQPVGLANWALSDTAPAARVEHTGSDDAIKNALKGDLEKLAMDKSFAAFTNPNPAFMAFAKSVFKSKLTQDLVTSLPVVGNIVSMGMLLSGKNLDGSEMNNYDYASAAIGMVPVVGNVAKALGGSAKIAAQEIAHLGTRFPAGSLDAIDLGLNVIGSNTAEAVSDGTPGWLSREFDAVAGKAISYLPKTSQAVAARGSIL